MKMWVISILVFFLLTGSYVMAFGDEVKEEALPPILGQDLNSAPQPPAPGLAPQPPTPGAPPASGPVPQPPAPGAPPASGPVPGSGPQPPRGPAPQPPAPGTSGPRPIASEFPNGNPDILKNVNQAIHTAEIVVRNIKPGNLWILRGPGGEAEVKAGILYRGVVIAQIRLDPVTGTPLPEGYHKRGFGYPIDVDRLKARFYELFSELKIAEVAEYRDPEASWAIPLTWDGRIVGFIRVYYDGHHVLPDYKGEEEMITMGK